MKVVYLIQTYRNPAQIYRLVKTIKQLSSDSYVLVNHDRGGCDLGSIPLKQLPGVEVIYTKTKVQRGRFSLVQAYLDAIHWLFAHGVEFDWLCNISGQDYPIQPLSKVERFLAESEYDGFLEYFYALGDPPETPWGSREGRRRYLYQYRWLRESLAPWQCSLMSPAKQLINRLQSSLYLTSTNGLAVGIKAARTPFHQQFRCYGGSEFRTLSRPCVQYLYEFINTEPELVDFYKRVCIPEESMIQTVLANSKLFKLCNDNKRYIDWSGNHHGHPRVLTQNDYPLLVDQNAHFARKFDIDQDEMILNLLDKRLFNMNEDRVSSASF